LVPVLEHLHQRSVCGSALEILDEVQQSNPVNQGYNNNKKERKEARKKEGEEFVCRNFGFIWSNRASFFWEWRLHVQFRGFLGRKVEEEEEVEEEGIKMGCRI